MQANFTGTHTSQTSKYRVIGSSSPGPASTPAAAGPTYAIEEGEEGYDKDIWGVGGPQRSRYYGEDGYDIELPYSVVWVARGYVSPDGEVHWSKAERLTSGRRDANQITIASSPSGLPWSGRKIPKG